MNEKKENDVTEENIDGMMHILRGIEMVYDMDIDERNHNRDRLEKVRREDVKAIEALTYSCRGTFVNELAALYAITMNMLAKYEELKKEGE